MFKAVVSGIGAYVPEGRLTNTALEQMVVTSDEWIVTRTGISERRIASADQATSDLAYEAAVRALADAKLTSADLDLIIVATSTPDHQLPPVACQIQHRLGCRTIGALDLNVTCAGFLSGLQIAEQFISTGKHQHVLVIGADTLSRVTDYTDRSTCILFSDGAGAFIISRGNDQDARGIIHSVIHSAGQHFNSLYIPGGGSRYPMTDSDQTKAKIVMDGRKIFKLAVHSMTETVQETLQQVNCTTEDIDWLIPHQANQRILDAVAQNLNFPEEKVISNIKYYGNNSAATLPLAMDVAVKRGDIKRGNLLMFTVFGAGLVWGSLLMEY